MPGQVLLCLCSCTGLDVSGMLLCLQPCTAVRPSKPSLPCVWNWAITLHKFKFLGNGTQAEPGMKQSGKAAERQSELQVPHTRECLGFGNIVLQTIPNSKSDFRPLCVPCSDQLEWERKPNPSLKESGSPEENGGVKFSHKGSVDFIPTLLWYESFSTPSCNR